MISLFLPVIRYASVPQTFCNRGPLPRRSAHARDHHRKIRHTQNCMGETLYPWLSYLNHSFSIHQFKVISKVTIEGKEVEELIRLLLLKLSQ
jgi:hypothetical protein